MEEVEEESSSSSSALVALTRSSCSRQPTIHPYPATTDHVAHYHSSLSLVPRARANRLDDADDDDDADELRLCALMVLFVASLCDVVEEVVLRSCAWRCL